HSDAEVTAICDVYAPYLDRAKRKIGRDVASYADFRKLLESKDVDAVVVATPDHWHALQAIAACRAGKDVYVEKPLSVTVREGRRMVEVAREQKRIVQVGTHRRSSQLYIELAKEVAGGAIGKVTVARAYRLSNMHPKGIGKSPPGPPPADLDWEMWLGPRPHRPFQATIAPYKFRWWHEYSSQMANWGVHYLDAIRWLTGELAPASICAMGGKFAIDDDRTVPDTLEATFQFASGRLAVFGQYEASGAPAFPAGGEIEFRGTLGALYSHDKGYHITAERGGQFQSNEPRLKPASGTIAEDATVNHTRNFLDCVRTRKLPNADIEIGHRSTTMSLLANISLAVGRRIEWDPAKEAILGDREASELLYYEYRKPWSLD
ncbi:MAG: Gfo/Idh/MocA family oxidoreductase, partial [Pirellulales bacterium]